MKSLSFKKAMHGLTALLGAATLVLWLLYSPLGHVRLLSAVITAGTTFYHLAMRLVVGAVVPRCVKKPTARRWFAQKGFEPRLYGMLRVRHWKAHMPTYDPASFSLGHNSVERIVYNSCVSEAVHEVIVLLSFIPLLFTFLWGAFPVFLITSVLSAAFDSCFIIMQRYNRPRLMRILAKKEARNL